MVDSLGYLFRVMLKRGRDGKIIAGNVYVYDGLGFRSASLSHVAERN